MMLVKYNVNDITDNDILKFPLIIQQAIDYLKCIDINNFSLGKYTINGDILYAIVDETITDFCFNKKPENHCKYYDLHFNISGEEVIYFTNFVGNESIIVDEMDDKDFRLYDVDMQYKQKVILNRTGDFIIIPTTVLHIPACHTSNKNVVKKIVIKIDCNQIIPIGS